MTFFIAASREYLKRNGTPESPEDLAHHDFVAVGNLDALQFTGPKGKIEVPLRIVLRYRSMSGVANAVVAGIGLAPLPDILFEDPTFKEVLKPVLTDYPLQEPTLYVVYVSRKHLPLKIRAFIDFLIEASASTTGAQTGRRPFIHDCLNAAPLEVTGALGIPPPLRWRDLSGLYRIPTAWLVCVEGACSAAPCAYRA